MHEPSTPRPAGQQHAAAAAASGGHLRWVICALLFFAATINYIDRQVIGILKPTLQQRIRLERDRLRGRSSSPSSSRMRSVCSWPGGSSTRSARKRGFVVAITIWSLAAMAHAEATLFGPGVAAFLTMFGLTYSASVAGLHLRALAAGPWRSGQLPGRHQGRRGMVSEARACVCHRAVQFRHQRRRAASRRSSCRGSR